MSVIFARAPIPIVSTFIIVLDVLSLNSAVNSPNSVSSLYSPSFMFPFMVIVVGSTFARIFYRNAVNIGLPVIKSNIKAKDEDILLVDLSSGIITNETTGESQEFEPFKDFMLEILEDGGLVNHHLKNKDKI